MPESNHEQPPKFLNDSTPPTIGEVRVDKDGAQCRWTETGYTIRQWFAHETVEKGPGPGWDSRMSLLDNERSLRRFGRTFSETEVFGGALPDEPYCEWREIDDAEDK